MDNFHYISSEVLSLGTINEIISLNKSIALSEEAKINIQKCCDYLDKKRVTDENSVQEFNNDFGLFSEVEFIKKNAFKIQDNLLKPHDFGVEEEVPHSIIKLILLLKIQSLSYGYSGVKLETVERLIAFYNNDIIPVIYTQGFVDASDDLISLSHLVLPLIGEGEVYFEGKKVHASVVMLHFNWEPIVLQSIEGLALINGTQFISAYGVHLLLKAIKYSYFSDLIAAISLEAFDGCKEPFNELIHFIRPHKGQIITANRILEFLEGSEISNQSKEHVQDPYSFRCIPQVHGATKDTIDYARKVFKTEINSVTDNSNIFFESEQIITGGNFHGQPLALALDFIAIGLKELGIISEKRTLQLVSRLSNLPGFSVDNYLENKGLTISQKTTASIASQNKSPDKPVYIGNIASSNDPKDHVSMGVISAIKALRFMDDLERILATELLNASQVIEFRRPLKSSDFIEMFLKSYREEIPIVREGRILQYDIDKSIVFLNSFNIDELEY